MNFSVIHWEQAAIKQGTSTALSFFHLRQELFYQGGNTQVQQKIKSYHFCITVVILTCSGCQFRETDRRPLVNCSLFKVYDRESFLIIQSAVRLTPAPDLQLTTPADALPGFQSNVPEDLSIWQGACPMLQLPACTATISQLRLLACAASLSLLWTPVPWFSS